MFGKNRNDRNSQDRYSNRERNGEERNQALERDLHRDDSQGGKSGQRFTSDDRTYSMNDRNFEPASRSGGRGSSAGDYGTQNSYRGEYSNDPFQRNSFSGQPGLPSANSNGRTSSQTGQGYRPYQDYGYSTTNDRGWSGVDDGGSSGYGATQGSSQGSQDRRHFGKGPKGYKRSDEKIHDEVCELLTSHYDIDASEIEVEVKEGVVTLGGSVESRRTKRMAEDVVADMNGVQDVRNNLRALSHETARF